MRLRVTSRPETLGLYRYKWLQWSMLPWTGALVLAVLTAGVSKEVHALREQVWHSVQCQMLRFYLHGIITNKYNA